MTTTTPTPDLTVEHTDPATLLVDVNIRTATTMDKDFTESIREHGVLVPIVAVRTCDGHLRVRYGHRRTLAAIQVGRTTVPVIVTGGDDADQVARIVTQWHENEHRAGLSTADKVAAVEQLSLLGLSAAQIVKRTKAPKAQVAQALAASGSALAKGAAERYEFLTLDQAAAVAEFEDDAEAVKALIAAAKKSEGDFAHVVQRARDERQEAAQVAAVTAEFVAANVTVVERPSYNDRATKSLHELVDDKGKQIDPDKHAACPGHVAWIARDWNGVRAVYGCSQWRTAGHRDRYSSTSGKPSAAEMTEAEREQARAERRQVVDNNKAWKSAESVRREWLATFLARKTAPKGSAAYVASEIARGPHSLTKAMDQGHSLALTLLGVDPAKGRSGLDQPVATATEARAQVISLALVLAAFEASTGPHTWRNATDANRRYFAFLAENGYSLSEVEKLAAGTAPKPKRPRRSRPAQAAAQANIEGDGAPADDPADTAEVTSETTTDEATATDAASDGAAA